MYLEWLSQNYEIVSEWNKHGVSDVYMYDFASKSRRMEPTRKT
jgi:hypothetical protein